MTPSRPLVVAITLCLGLSALATSSDADAQRRRAVRAPAVAPACTDFYSVGNAAWLAANPVPAAGASSALTQLLDNANTQQKALLDAAAQQPANDVQKLLGDFWASGLDEAAVEADGSRPIAPLLTRINAIGRNRDLPATIAALHQVGIPVAFNFGADVDLKALDRHLGYFMQGGTGLPDPAFYTRDDADILTVRNRYRDYIKQILALTGTPAGRLEAEANAVLALETALATPSQALAQINNPFNNYAPVPVAGLDRQYRNLRLGDFLKAQGVTAEQVSLAEPAVFVALDGLVKNRPVADWKAYLRWRVGDAMAPYLSQTYRQAEFEFRGRLLRGQTIAPERWVHVLEAVNLAAGPMLGREYTATHLTGADRRQAGLIIDKLREAQIAAIMRNPQLSEQAKSEARAKLEAMKIEIGAPLRDLDYSVQPMGRGSFGSNMLIASTWRHREEMKRIGQANADRRWDVLPQQPALSYDIAQNRLIATAAVLQPPVFDPAGNTAAKFGSFGALVGHELTRAVDNKGALIDARGELRSWWTPADQTAWTVLADRLGNQLAALPYPGVRDVRINPALVRESAIADLSGLELAWQTWQGIETEAGKNEAQAFFTAWARLWPQAVSPNEAIARHGAQVQLPGPVRVNALLANLPAFAQAFGCSAGQPMQLPAAQQVQVWP